MLIMSSVAGYSMTASSGSMIDLWDWVPSTEDVEKVRAMQPVGNCILKLSPKLCVPQLVMLRFSGAWKSNHFVDLLEALPALQFYREVLAPRSKLHI